MSSADKLKRGLLRKINDGLTGLRRERSTLVASLVAAREIHDDLREARICNLQREVARVNGLISQAESIRREVLS